MHKKLAADLTSLAHSILQMKNKEDVFALQQKAHELYEKLSVLAYVEEYINNTPNPLKSKEELIAEIVAIEESKEKVIEEMDEEPSVKEEPAKEIVDEKEPEGTDINEEQAEQEKVTEEVKEEQTAELFESIEVQKEETEVQESNEETIEEITTLEEEFKDTIAVDVAADLFEAAPKKSLNDKLQGDIQIGLNDRIAFVKNLFDGSQEDFNRVVSQLNTLKTYREAKKFINKMVKPDYNWTDKEELEERFMNIVERKFV